MVSFNNSKVVTVADKPMWKNPLKVRGTLEHLTSPIRPNKEVSIYSFDQRRPITYRRRNTVTEVQFELNYLEWDPKKNFKGSKNIFGYTYPGLNPLQQVVDFSWVSSLPAFQGGNSLFISHRSRSSFVKALD